MLRSSLNAGWFPMGLCALVLWVGAGCSPRSTNIAPSATDTARSAPGSPTVIPQNDGPAPSSAITLPIGARLDGATAPAGVPVSVQQPTPEVPPEFVQRGIDWLVEAQHLDGGWGAGSHAQQQVRDPRAVQTDPATTAFAATALLRAGSTPLSGKHQDAVRRAVEYLLSSVESAPDDGPRITSLEGTQPQSKLGPLIDTSMTLQLLARVLPTLAAEQPLHARVDRAVDKCLRKLEASQEDSGSWGGGGWAPVLQSSMGCAALEYTQAAGKSVSADKLESARRYQMGNFDRASGRADGAEAAGVELYAFAGAAKAAAAEAGAALALVNDARTRGLLPPTSEVSADNIESLGVAPQRAAELAAAYSQNQAQVDRLDDASLLSGFGSNGGEEFLSYLFTSEALITSDPEAFARWDDKMRGMLAKIQADDGSWTGHHCITSPVFCTAAVVQCLTTEHDRSLLTRVRDQVMAGRP